MNEEASGSERGGEGKEARNKIKKFCDMSCLIVLPANCRRSVHTYQEKGEWDGPLSERTAETVLPSPLGSIYKIN